MRDVSLAYRNEMRQQSRYPSYVTARWGLIDQTAADDMTAISDTESKLSEVQKISRYRKPAAYALYENRGYRLGAGQLIVPHDVTNVIYQGFESGVISNGESMFDTSPFIDMTFASLHRVVGLLLTFDAILRRHPRTIRVQAYNDFTSIMDNIYTVDSPKYEIPDEMIDFNRIRITWLASTEPHQRARLSHIMFGLNMTLDWRVIERTSGTTQVDDIDPIGRRLPVQTFKVTFINVDKMYDNDNPDGLWAFVDTKTPIDIEYEQELSSGGSEIIPAGKRYLDSMPIVDGQRVTLSGSGAIANMSRVYYKSKNYLAGRTLYDIAVDVFSDAGITVQEYYLNPILKDYSTSAFLPLIEHKNCLKLIAEAGMCRLYDDVDGLTRIEPNSTSAAYEMKAAASDQSFISNAQGTALNNKERAYALFESQGYRLGAKQIIAPHDVADALYQGFISESLSNDAGEFVTLPYIDMTFRQKHRKMGLMFEFDSILQRHPRTIRIEIWSGATLIKDEALDINNHRHIIDEEIIGFNRVKMTWLKSIVPHQRAWLERITFGTDKDFRLDFWDFPSAPTSDPSPQLQAINTTTYTYVIKEAKEEIAKAEIVPSDDIQWVTFGNAENITYETTGAVTDMTIYGASAFFRCTMSGSIVFRGNRIIKSENKLTHVYADTGEIETIENPLITDSAHAEAVTSWKAEYLQQRNTYYSNYRGDPSIEANDIISIQTNFSKDIPVRILKNEVNWNGALHGRIIAKWGTF